MRAAWGNKTLWNRVGVVASAVWLGAILIVSTQSRNFEWFPDSYTNEVKSVLHFGPAFIVAIVGIAVIIAICAGIPWIAASIDSSDQ